MKVMNDCMPLLAKSIKYGASPTTNAYSFENDWSSLLRLILNYAPLLEFRVRRTKRFSKSDSLLPPSVFSLLLYYVQKSSTTIISIN